MRTTSTEEIRNIVLIGQKGAGKTSLGEAMLFSTKSINRLGKVSEGNTVLDFEPEEHKRVASVESAIASAEWRKHKINIIDTPGSLDFLGDTQSALRMADIAVVVVSAIDGVEPYSARLFAQAQGMARAVVINQMGRERADFDRVLGQIRERLTPQAVPLTVPIGSAERFGGVIDLMRQKAHVYERESQKEPGGGEVSREHQEAASHARALVLEEIAGTDETLMEHYLDSGDLGLDEALAGLRRAIGRGDLCPVFVTDAAHNVGTFQLLDMLVDLFPSPAGRAFPQRDAAAPPVSADPDGSFVGLVFRTLMDQHSGKISVFRVIRGRAIKDSQVHTSRGGHERLGTLVSLQGKKHAPQDEAATGDIVGAAKLKDTHTGDTLSAEGDAQLAHPELPPPQITFRIVPKSKSDEDKIGSALEKLREEDPTLVVGHDELTADLTLSGFGVAHIDVALEKMTRKYAVEVQKLAPLVPYREYLSKPAKGIEGKHKKQSGGRGQFGVCFLNVRPLARGAGFVFVDSVTGGAIPRQYIPAVQRGVEEAAKHGVLAGYPLIDFEVELYDGKYHDVDSSEMAFKIAGSKGFKEAVRAAGVGILEPVMDVEIEVPQECLGDVVGDVSSRRGRVHGMDTQGTVSTVKAQIPQAEILTYAPDLKSMTGGRGAFQARFSHYDPLPGHLTDAVVSGSPKKPRDED